MRAAKKMGDHKVATTTSLLMEAKGVLTAKIKVAIAKKMKDQCSLLKAVKAVSEATKREDP